MSYKTTVALLIQFKEVIKCFSEEDQEKYKSVTIENTTIDFDQVIKHVTNCSDCQNFKFVENIFCDYIDLRKFLPSYVFPCGNTLEEIFVKNETTKKNIIDFWDSIISESIPDTKPLETIPLSDEQIEYKTIQTSFIVNQKYELLKEKFPDNLDKLESVQFYPSNMLSIFSSQMANYFGGVLEIIKYVNATLKSIIEKEQNQYFLSICSSIEEILNMIDYKKLDFTIQKFIHLKKIILQIPRNRIASDQYKDANSDQNLNKLPLLININDHCISYFLKCMEVRVKEHERLINIKSWSPYAEVVSILKNPEHLKQIEFYMQMLQDYQNEHNPDDRLLIDNFLNYSNNKNSELIYFIDSGIHEIIIHFANVLIRQLISQIVYSNKFFSNSIKYWETGNLELRDYVRFNLESFFAVIKIIDVSIDLIFLLDKIYDLIEKSGVLSAFAFIQDRTNQENKKKGKRFGRINNDNEKQS